MHELGLVTHIVQTVEEISREEQVKKVSSVTLELGEVSGVIPDYLMDCWKYFRVKSQFLEEAELRILEIPAVTVCEDCKETYSTLKFKKVCPHCGSEATHLITGNEFIIKEIEACS